jgi:hypothetical protein
MLCTVIAYTSADACSPGANWTGPDEAPSRAAGAPTGALSGPVA